MSSSKYNLDYFLQTINTNNCEIIKSSSSLIIKINDSPAKIYWKKIELDIGIYNLDINIDNNFVDGLDDIAILYFSNNIYKLRNGKNHIDLYITDIITNNTLTIDLIKNTDYNISLFEISNNINDILFEPCDTQLFDPSENSISKEKVITEANIENNNIYPIQPMIKKVIHGKQSRRSRIFKQQSTQSKLQVIPEQNKQNIIPIEQSISISSNKPTKIIISNKRVHKTLIKKNNSTVDISIDKIFIFNSNNSNTLSLYKYYTDFNIACEIINDTDIENNVQNKELVNKINQWMIILNQAIKNKYQYIMLLSDTLIPNISNRLFKNDNIINHDFKDLYDFITLDKSNDTINACIIKSTLFGRIMKSISNYSFSPENHIKIILKQPNYKSIELPKFFVPMDFKNINAINYLYFIDDVMPIDTIISSLNSLNNQTYKNYYLTIYYSENFDIKSFKKYFPKICYLSLVEYQSKLYNSIYDIILQKYSEYQQKYICVLPCKFTYNESLIEIYNKSLSKNADFINCGYTINDKTTYGQLYTLESFLYTELIQIYIIKTSILQFCIDKSQFTYYKNIIGSSINKDIIYDSYAKSDNDLEYMSITENNKKIEDSENPEELNLDSTEELSLQDEMMDIFMKSFDLSKDTILCFYSTNSINNTRLFNICKNLQKYYNILIISSEQKYIDNIVIIDFNDIKPYIDIIKVNKIIALVNHTNTINKIQNLPINDMIIDITNFKLISKLNEYIKNIMFITYSSITFEDNIKSCINDNIMYYTKNNKNIPQLLYIPNCINNTIIIDDVKPESLRNDNINVSYIGAVNRSLDFNIIKNIANNAKKLGITLNIINTKKSQDGNKLMFQDDNIHWLDISNNDNIDNEIQKYIKYSNIIIFPIVDDDKYKCLNTKEFNMALYYNKPIISTFDYLSIENYVNKADSLIITGNKWVDNITKIIQELNCNIQFNYQSFNDKQYAFYSDELYKMIQTNETLFLTRISDKINKTCAIITQIIDNDTLIYGYHQYIILCLMRILMNNGIKPTIYQLSETKKHNKSITFRDNTFKVHFIVNDDLYTLNNYDCTIYDSLALDFIKNIVPNSIYLNFEISKDILNKCDKFINGSILTLSVNTIFNSIYSYVKDGINNHKIYYVPCFHVMDKINNTTSKIILNNEIQEEKDDIINIPNSNVKLFVNIPYYNIELNDIDNLKYLLTQIRNKDIQFNIRLTIKPSNEIISQLNHLKILDDRLTYTILDSYTNLITYYTNNSITLFIDNNTYTHLEYYNAIAHKSIIIISPNNTLTSQIINKFNGLILDSTNINSIIKTLNNTINNYNSIKNHLAPGIEYTINNYSYQKWEKSTIKILNNIAWIYNKLPDTSKHNHLININKDEINANYQMFWKNYAHTLNIQNYYKSVEVSTAIKKHFDINQNCSLKIAQINKNMMILIDNNNYSDISYIINNICQYINVHVYVYTENNQEIKYNDFIYETINKHELLKAIKQYNLLMYFNLNEELLELIKKSNISTIQYINDIDDINSNYISYSFPTKIISHSGYISNYLSCKYNIIPEIIPYPIKYMIDPNNSENKENKQKKNICCFTLLNNDDGIDIFIKMIKRYQTEYGTLNEKYNLIIYYYPYNNKILDNLKNKIKLLNVFIEFVEIKKNIDYYIFNSDLIIIPILHNYIPLVLLRGMLYNKNIMVSSQYAIREFNTLININGYSQNMIKLFRPNDVANLKNCFLNWINSNQEINEQESEYIKKYYNSELFINKLVDTINMI